jgi:hypothetical protein
LFLLYGVLFGFFGQMWLQQESFLFGLLKISQALLELVGGGLVGRWFGGPAGQWGGGLVGLQGGDLAGRWAVARGMGVAPCLFFQCIIAWRNLP